MKKFELKQLIKEEIIQQKLLEEKNQKASKINQNLSNLIEKIKKDFNIQKIEYKFLNRETGLQDI